MNRSIPHLKLLIYIKTFLATCMDHPTPHGDLLQCYSHTHDFVTVIRGLAVTADELLTGLSNHSLPPPPCDLLQCSSHPPLPTPPLTNYPGHSHYPCDFISTTHTTPDLVKVIRRLPVSADVLQTQSGNHPPYPPLVLTLPLTL